MAPWTWLEPHGSGESESKEWTKEVFHQSLCENQGKSQSQAGLGTRTEPSIILAPGRRWVGLPDQHTNIQGGHLNLISDRQ